MLNPARLDRLLRHIATASALGALALGVPGVVLALFFSPPDALHGDNVRILYVHVPSAWLATLGYALMACAAAIALVWRNAIASLTVRAAAPLGIGFTIATIASGAIWGKTAWGAWWVWDARLTSVLVLLFFYVAYWALVNGFDNREKSERAANMLVLIGVINLPIIKFSVEWWNTLHQPASLLRLSGPRIDESMLVPLLLTMGGFMLLFAHLLAVRLQTEMIAQRCRARQQHLHFVPRTTEQHTHPSRPMLDPHG